MELSDIDRVYKQKLHIGSGVEFIIDDNLKTSLDEYGQYGISSDANMPESISKVTLNSSKSYNEDELAQSIFSVEENVKKHDIIGYYTNLYVGRVIEGGYRSRGSSGGLVSWCAAELMRLKEIDGFIHVKRSAKKGILFEYGISRTIDDIQAGAKSRYYPAELSRCLKEVMDTPGQYAIVAIPEIIAEVRLLAESEPVIKDRIKYFFGLVCGHQKTTKYAEAVAWEYGIKPGDLKDINFRYKKNTGSAIQYDMKFSGLVDGLERTFVVRNNEPFVASWAHGFFKAKFSDFTDNAFNELADITFGDAWLEEYIDDSMGNNIVIVRNSRIEHLLQSALNEKRIKLDEVDEETILRSQQGLIHHTRDEISHRLNKERLRYGWSPAKRPFRDTTLSSKRKRVQDARQDIAEKSHEYYREAVKRDDFEYFRQKMTPYIDKYNEMYGINSMKSSKPVKADGAILTLTGYFNYGNVIQRYALQEHLRQKGFNFISYVDSFSSPKSIYKISRIKKLKKPLRALKRFFNYQRPYWYTPTYGEVYPEAAENSNIIQFVNNNIWIKEFSQSDDYSNYIVGSDQVWRDWWSDREILGYYFFNFLKGRKTNRIAYAASFGKDNIKEVIKEDDIEYIRPYLQMFNGVSVREKSAVKMIEDTWGVENVKEVLDPTLLLNAQDYSRLIDKSEEKYSKIQPIYTYLLGEDDNLSKFVRKVQEYKQSSVTKVNAHSSEGRLMLPNVELWLKGFRDSELVVTNSFHGMMFSIINNTDFIIIGREVGGLSRIVDFLDKFNITGRLALESDLDKFSLSDLNPIDWVRVNEILDREKEASSKWLTDRISR